FRLELCGYRGIELLALQCRLEGFFPVSQDLFLGKNLALLGLCHGDTSLRTTDREWEVRARETSSSFHGLQRFEFAAQRASILWPHPGLEREQTIERRADPGR